ncbi:MAG: NAD-dependent epimerase/dehydratase family protein [Phycisphaerae bacterium]
MILVTGSQGLVGREVCRMLTSLGHIVRGIDVRPGLDQPGVATMLGDLLIPHDCTAACRGATAIIHTAARQYHDGVPAFGRRAFFRANVTMTENLVEAAVAADVKHIVYVSSDMVYGLPPDRPLRETDEPNPIGEYGRSKLAGERACEAAREVDLKVTVLRPRLIIGPGRLGVLRKLFDRIRSGGRVPMFGDGRNRYQMVAVDDVARACVLAAQGGIEGTFNLGSSEPPIVRELLSEVIRRAASRSRLRVLPKRPAIAALRMLDLLRIAPLAPEQFLIAGEDYVLDTREAAGRLGWKPQHSDIDMLWQAYEAYVRGDVGKQR